MGRGVRRVVRRKQKRTAERSGTHAGEAQSRDVLGEERRIERRLRVQSPQAEHLSTIPSLLEKRRTLPCACRENRHEDSNVRSAACAWRCERARGMIASIGALLPALQPYSTAGRFHRVKRPCVSYTSPAVAPTQPSFVLWHECVPMHPLRVVRLMVCGSKNETKAGKGKRATLRNTRRAPSGLHVKARQPPAPFRSSFESIKPALRKRAGATEV